jgi:putative membrane protein
MKDAETPLPGKAADHLANERTFLAWIRTAIAVMAFGFVVVKFSLFMKQLELIFSETTTVVPARGYSSLIGIILVALGGLICLLSYLQFKKNEKQLNNNTYSSSSVLISWFSVVLIIGSIFLALYLLPNL